MIDRLYSKRISAPSPVFIPLDDKGDVIQLPVDQFSGQEFMRNPNGFVTNDIMMFEECQSDSVARSILHRLKILHPQSIDQNMTVDQMMANAIPSNYGSPSEFVSAQKSVAEKMFKFYQDDVRAYQARAAAAAEKQMQQEKSELEGSIPKSE